MRSKYKKSLIFILIMIVICCVIGTNYLFYEKSVGNEMIVEADGELSINYIKSKKIRKDGTYEFSVTNNSDKDFYYEIAIEKRRNYNDKTTYSIMSGEANININNMHLEKNKLTLINNILISSKTTQTFIITIKDLKDMKFDLVVHKNNDTEEYFYATIIKNNPVQKEPSSQIGEASTASEGLIEEMDDLGVTYYFRGVVPNNYVSINDKLWRIVRINGDGTIRLILDSTTTELTSYHENNNYEDYTKTTIYKNLQSYYENNLKEYDKLISNSKFCSELGSSGTDTEKTYNAYTRIITNKIPTFNCLGDTVISKIGLITADEVIFAGGTNNSDNKDFYLYNDKIDNSWWTSNLATSKSNSYYPFTITPNGKLNSNDLGSSFKDLRPVINIVKKSTVTGSGTLEDPYIINE